MFDTFVQPPSAGQVALLFFFAWERLLCRGICSQNSKCVRSYFQRMHPTGKQSGCQSGGRLHLRAPSGVNMDVVARTPAVYIDGGAALSSVF
eukprot:5463915-Pyramimonas_sp.AAC.1